MLGAIWASIRGVFALLGWAKQNSDQAQGAALLRGEEDAKTLAITQKIADARLDPGNIHSVHSRSRADD